MHIFQKTIFLTKFNSNFSDPRTRDWILIGSIYQISLILIVYLFVILYWGPRFMKNRLPYSLKTFIKIYNIFQIITNAWLVREHLAAGWMKDIPLTCVPITYSYDQRYFRVRKSIFLYIFTRII